MIIYKITNLVNGKVYIGQTIHPIERRWYQHKKVKCDSLIHKAIVKYGEENFTIEEIDSAVDSDDLNDKEVFWIAHYNSLAPNGYNLGAGGNQKNKPAKPIYQYDLDGNFIRRWDSTKDVVNSLGLCQVALNSCANGKDSYKSVGGFRWSYELKELPPYKRKPCPPPKKKPVFCVQLNKVYDSIEEAAAEFGLSTQHIANCCRYQLRARGFELYYVDERLTNI